MSKALIRVIEQQQKNIDSLESIVSTQAKSMSACFEREQDLFSLVDEMFTCRGSEKYAEARNEVMGYMIKHGWCFECGGFGCEGDD